MTADAKCPMCGRPCELSSVMFGGGPVAVYACPCVTTRHMWAISDGVGRWRDDDLLARHRWADDGGAA